MNRLDATIADVAYILDTLIAYRNIAQTGNCNNCGYRHCPHAPKLGETVRYNCYQWRKKDERDM